MENNIIDEDELMRRSVIVNYFGGPGSGKSTLCADVFSELKWQGVNCEIAPEYAKGIVWEGSLNKLRNQIYIFGKQHQTLFRLCGEVDVILTDSPIIFSTVYDKRKDPLFRSFVLQEFNRFNNLNFFVNRTKKYMPKGRTQTEDEARVVDGTIQDLLLSSEIPFHEVAGERESVEGMVEKILAVIR